MVTKSEQKEYLADNWPNFSISAMKGGQEQEPKLRTIGLPSLQMLRRLTTFLVATSRTGTSGAGDPKVDFFRTFSIPFTTFHYKYIFIFIKKSFLVQTYLENIIREKEIQIFYSCNLLAEFPLVEFG